MKQLMRSMTAVALAAMLAMGAVGCGGGPDQVPGGGTAPPADAPPADAEKKDGSSTDAGSGDIGKDDMATAIGAAMDGDARWEGETLHVKLTQDQGENGVRAFTNCRVTDEMLEDHQSTILEFTDGTVSCVDILPED